VSPLIPEDVHAVCVEDAERLREQRDMYRATALALRLDLAHTEARLIAGDMVAQEIRAQLAEQDAMICEAADEMAASVKASLMDAQHDHAHTLETERRLRACLARYAHALIRNGALSRPSIGGQTVTAWKCGLCGSEQASGSTAHDYVCEVCRAGLIEHAKGEERARAEGKPAEGGK
jgi:hypothetical protein